MKVYSNIMHTVNAIKNSIDEINKYTNRLKEYGFKVEGKLPNLKKAMQNQINQEKYRNNKTIQRVRRGEDIEQITERLIKERSWKLRYNKKEREKYNAKVNELSEMFDATILKVGPFYSSSEVEGLTTYMTVISSLATFGFSYLLELKIGSRLAFTVFNGTGCGLIGLWVGYTLSSEKKWAHGIKDRAKYFKDILE
jgi:hypothetical protein